jgi:hypothetical protein
MADGNEAAPGDEPPAEDSSKAFFLALAAKGKEAWNAWRRDPANKDVRVTFAGIDFSQAPMDGIDFSGFEFGDYANFSRCKWRGVKWEESFEVFLPGRASFNCAAFGDEANFIGAAFGDGANFTGAAFGDRAIFFNAAFGDGANFTGAAFGYVVTFEYAAFGDEANFTGAAFGDDANFTGAAFGYLASFLGATFGDVASFGGAAFGEARFDNAFFKGYVEFTGKSTVQRAEDLDARPNVWGEESRAALEKRHGESWTRYGSGPDRFLFISFWRARFDSEADLSGRSFERTANFTNARFFCPPDFGATTNTSRINLTGAYIGFGRPFRFHWTSDPDVPLRLRALRKLAEETKNHDLERDLYIEERKAERGVYWRQLLDELKKAPEELKKKLKDIDEQQREVWSNSRHKARARNAHVLEIAVKIARLAVHGFWIAVMGLYWVLADYGRSFLRPFAWLIASGIFFYWGYLAVLTAKASPPDIDKYKQAVRMLVLGNSVPFVGPLTIDSEIKKLLVCPSGPCPSPLIPPEGYQWLVLSQNLLSIILVFFIGFALRNYFKIK